jgi:hypothetical protein
MRITILNGEPERDTDFDRYVTEVTATLAADGHLVARLDLRDLGLRDCSGCFGCWVKTPGACVQGEAPATVCRAAMDADLVMFASPMVMGFTSALLKRAADHMIPLVHPYFTIEGGEMHHVARYDRYPLFALLLGQEDDTDPEDLEITEALWARMARNMKSRLAFTTVADRSAQEVAHGIAAAA